MISAYVILNAQKISGLLTDIYEQFILFIRENVSQPKRKGNSILRVTTYDIARICGVSQATVDRALNNRSNIRQHTKEKIMKTAAELGYRPSNLPQYLKTGKTNTIGIILPKAILFYTELIGHLTNILKVQGYQTCISFSDFNVEQEKQYLAEFLSMDVDGIILFPVSDDGTEIRKIINSGIPVVTLIRKMKNYNFDFVSINYAKVSEQAIQYLIDLGHRKICYYTIWDSSSNLYTYNQRMKGYESALKKNGIPVEPKLIVRDTDSYQLLQELLHSENRPTAFYCFNDINAIGLVSYLNSIALNVPRDLSIISFDNTDMLRYFTPRLTSISYPYHELCAKAAEILLNKIKSPSDETQTCIFDAHIVYRKSCGRI